MRRELDLTALRSLVAVAESGGVTKAAHLVNLSQSAVSMQIKRLEDVLQCEIFDRQGRGVALTAAGEQLLSYAKRLLALNDEAFGRLTNADEEGEITLGVPHDIVYPLIPHVLQQFARAFPRVRIRLQSSFTKSLLAEFEAGACDVILTTEKTLGEGAETLTELPLVWVGAPGGTAWRQRPLRLAYEQRCIFRQGVQAALDKVGISWELAVESDNTRTIEATVSADLAVHTVLAGSEPPYVEQINHGGALPALGGMNINLYVGQGRKSPALVFLVDLIRQAYRTRHSETTPLRMVR